MSHYRVDFTTTLDVRVTVDARDSDEAVDRAWETAAAYVHTVSGQGQVSATADVDAMRAVTVTRIAP